MRKHAFRVPAACLALALVATLGACDRNKSANPPTPSTELGTPKGMAPMDKPVTGGTAGASDHAATRSSNMPATGPDTSASATAASTLPGGVPPPSSSASAAH